MDLLSWMLLFWNLLAASRISFLRHGICFYGGMELEEFGTTLFLSNRIIFGILLRDGLAAMDRKEAKHDAIDILVVDHVEDYIISTCIPMAAK